MTSNPNVILQGGPTLTDDERVRHVDNTDRKFKLFRGNRYDHFEPTSRRLLRNGRELKVFVWTESTYVAE